MKHPEKPIFCFISLVILLSVVSCADFTKRKYRKGFYVAKRGEITVPVQVKLAEIIQDTERVVTSPRSKPASGTNETEIPASGSRSQQAIKQNTDILDYRLNNSDETPGSRSPDTIIASKRTYDEDRTSFSFLRIIGGIVKAILAFFIILGILAMIGVILNVGGSGILSASAILAVQIFAGIVALVLLLVLFIILKL
jgi:hypothetical protein